MSIPSRAAALTVLLALVVLFWFTSYAKGQQPANCATVDRVLDLVTGQKYREVEVARGTMQGLPLIIYRNESTGTFSIVLFGPNFACIVGGGSDFKWTGTIGEPA